VEALYRGRIDLTLKPCLVNAKLINFGEKAAIKFPFPEPDFLFNWHSSSSEPQEIAPVTTEV
jgi:hypothetical protein